MILRSAQIVLALGLFVLSFLFAMMIFLLPLYSMLVLAVAAPYVRAYLWASQLLQERRAAIGSPQHTKTMLSGTPRPSWSLSEGSLS